MNEPVRCSWATASDPLLLAYHDEEWAVPVHDDRTLFEFLILEGAQAGLSWRTVLHKREGYRRAFADFDPDVVARFTTDDERALHDDAGIVRHRQKIASVPTNARAFLKIQADVGSFSTWLWSFVDGTPIVSPRATPEDVPTSTPLSDEISRALKRRGFTFVGTTIVYAYLQAVGLVDDHLVGCTRRGG